MPKQCDGCKFCCTVLGVRELKKPPHTRCVYATQTGCSIHNDPLLFPATCRDFECGYLVSDLPVEFRPDRCHIMITGEEASLQAHFLQVDPAYPNAPQTPIGQQLIKIVLSGGKYPNIVLTTGDQERIISRDPKSAAKLRKQLDKMKNQIK